jgi:hypothetical protein
MASRKEAEKRKEYRLWCAGIAGGGWLCYKRDMRGMRDWVKRQDEKTFKTWTE